MADQVDVCEGSVTSGVTGLETTEDMDERIATVLHLQQLQQKQEVNQLMESHTVTNADAEFRRGLEELVRDHLNTCMALASCSSAHDPGISSSGSSNVMSRPPSFNSMQGDASDTHHLLHDNDHNLHHYPSTLHRDDVQSHHPDVQIFQAGESPFCSTHHILDNEQSDDEEENNTQLAQGQGEGDGSLSEHSPPQEQPRSRILSIWAAQHAQEMITTMERQAREAELLALAGLHTVSTLDASFLRESPGRSDSSVDGSERPRRRASSLVQMWRELEEERRAERARNDFEDRMALRMENVNFPEDMGNSENQEDIQGADIMVEDVNAEGGDSHETQQDDQREIPLGSGNPEYRAWEDSETERRNDILDSSEGSERHSSQIGDGEREHVRQIVQRLMTDTGMQGSLSTAEQTQNRAAWLDENERERVRELAREWVRVTNEQRVDVWDGRGASSRRQGLQTGITRGQARERQMVQESTASEDLDGSPERMLGRDERRFRDRQVILDLLMRIESERQRELQHLLEHRAVSDFAHRNRLQSLLRGRFLRTGAAREEERPPSLAAGELGQLRQRRAVSGLREGFRFRLETVLRSQASNRSGAERSNVHGQAQSRRSVVNQHVVLPSRGRNAVTRGAPSEGVSRDWQGIAAARRVAELQNLEESTAYNMELQELLGRRSVTNVLASEFRDRLDQLIRSFIQSQGRTPVAWDFTRGARTNVSPQQQPPVQRQQQEPQQVRDERVNGTQLQPAVTPPPPPPPPPQPLWQQELQQHTPWPRPSLHRPSYIELESINELRTDVSKLQHAMSDLHRMMETCMEMQLELQRSVRQELAGALQRMYDGKALPDEAVDGSKWVSVKRGICCVCCDKNIDSLLYRCGHMSTCLKCASELMRNSGKCPMCRAPIVEVVRAFTVM